MVIVAVLFWFGVFYFSIGQIGFFVDIRFYNVVETDLEFNHLTQEGHKVILLHSASSSKNYRHKPPHQDITHNICRKKTPHVICKLVHKCIVLILCDISYLVYAILFAKWVTYIIPHSTCVNTLRYDFQNLKWEKLRAGFQEACMKPYVINAHICS